MIPAEDTKNIGGSWSALSEAGEATNLNLVHLTNIDCTDVEDLTKVCQIEVEVFKMSMKIFNVIFINTRVNEIYKAV